MARRSTGAVVERRTKRGVVYALRFYAAGNRQYETLGSDAEGWNRRKAEDELAAVMAAVRVGTGAPQQLGHENPAFTFRVYQRATKRRDRLNGTHLRAFDRALMGAGAAEPAKTSSPLGEPSGRKPHS